MKIASPISQSADVKAAVVELSTIRNAVTAFRRLLHHSKTREERESGKAAAKKAQLSSLTVPLDDASGGTGAAVPGLSSPPGRTEYVALLSGYFTSMKCNIVDVLHGAIAGLLA